MDTEKKERRSHKRILQGIVVSDVNDKTITVRVERLVPHPLYGKYYRRFRKFMAHDAGNEAHIGDTVRIIECRPLSARKRWRLLEIVERKR